MSQRSLPTDVRIVPATEVPPETVWEAFCEGFKGYVRPFEIGFEPFMGMIRAEDVDLAASVVALDTDGAPVGVALLAIRGEMSWCGGLGVAPRMRRQGLGRVLMERIIDAARARGLPRMRLECIDGNDAARALYDTLGYRALRRLDVFEGMPATPRRPSRHDLPVVVIDSLEGIWADFARYHPVPPPWQGELVGRRAEAAAGPTTALGLGSAASPDAYVLVRIREAASAPIYLIDAGVRSEGGDPVANLTELVARLVAEHPDRAVVAFNIPEESPLDAVLHRFGVPVTLTQTEMVLDL